MMKSPLKIGLVALAAIALLSASASAQGVLFVKNNMVGIGVDPPLHNLDVVDTAGSGNTVVGRFANNGAPLVKYQDTTLGVSWFLAPLSNGDFTISKEGTGGAEFLVRQNGQVRMGPGATTTFDLLSNGNLTITGTLTQGSSREIKENFEALNGRDALDRVANLELLEWSYKDQAERHFGPMAEDFHSVFGFGPSEKGLAPGDVAGVALLAIQGLNDVVEEKNHEIEQLRRELTELRMLVESVATR